MPGGIAPGAVGRRGAVTAQNAWPPVRRTHGRKGAVTSCRLRGYRVACARRIRSGDKFLSPGDDGDVVRSAAPRRGAGLDGGEDRDVSALPGKATTDYSGMRSSREVRRVDDSQLLKGVLPTVVLAALSGGAVYGYSILREIRSAGLADVGDASVYGTLQRLFGDGHISTYMAPSERGPARKCYALTPQGEQALTAGRAQWTTFRDAVDAMVSTGERDRI